LTRMNTRSWPICWSWSTRDPRGTTNPGHHWR
jgi:hypothetical protein